MSQAPASPTGPSRTYDAIVVGAGIIGCAISLELGRGRRVLCVAGGPAAGSGSTGASSAIVRFHYSDAVATTVAWDSYFDWTARPDYVDLPRGEPLARYVTTGALVLDAPGSPRPAALGHFDALGIPYQQLTAADIRREFPEMCTQSFWPPKTPDDPAFWDPGRGELGGYLTPAAGYVDDPQLATRNLMLAATQAGVTFQFRRLAHRVIMAGDRASGIELDGAEESLNSRGFCSFCCPAALLWSWVSGVRVPSLTPLKEQVRRPGRDCGRAIRHDQCLILGAACPILAAHGGDSREYAAGFAPGRH